MKKHHENNRTNHSRRRFLKLGLGLGAGLAVGGYLGWGGERVKDHLEIWDHVPTGWKADAWLHIAEDGVVTVRVNHTEMGQGVATALPMIVAEELDADWSKVRFEIAPAEAVYKNPEFGIQMTAGSTSVRTSWDILRRAGATARHLLIQAGAGKIGVEPGQCRTDQGRVIAEVSGNSLTYGELAVAASGFSRPEAVKLKGESSFGLVGHSPARLDSREKITGRARFGIDVAWPGLLTATVLHPPVFGEGLGSFEAKEAMGKSGVQWIGPISTGLAVVADTFWQAKQAAEAVRVSWKDGGRRAIDTQAIFRRWEEMSRTEQGKACFALGDLESAKAKSTQVVQAVYRLPYQAHATPEPMNCTASVHDGVCEVWAPTQNQDAAQEEAARLTGLPYHRITVHTTYVGGGFGRRVDVDYVTEAVELALKLQKPVKVIWTREEDMRQDRYRPASLNRMEAGLDADGRILWWRHRIVGPDHMGFMAPRLAASMMPYWVPRTTRNALTWLGRRVMPRVVTGKKVAEGAAPSMYDLDNILVEHMQDDPGIPTGFWRSVAHSSNCFVKECFLDELAVLTQKDPVQFRLGLLTRNPPLGRLVEMTAQRAGWGVSAGPGSGWGVAVHDFHGTLLCCLAQVALDARGRITVPRVVCGVDCGQVINPKIAEGQIRGGLVFGLTAALKGSITISGGQVDQGNFHDFPVLSYSEMPDCEVFFVESRRPPTGLGEASVPVIGPAVANAAFAVTGRRERTLPLTKERLDQSGG
jgi:CO/xanthine dehydrogenase Mo-binding subunit